MRIINRSRLRDFWVDHERIATAIHAWFQLISSHDWDSAEALTSTFPAATSHGDLVAFDIRGSSLFIIATVDFPRATVWVRTVMLHSEFRSDKWKALMGSETGAGRSYPDLVNEFPLRPIRDDEHLQQALARIDSLLAHAERSTDEQDYLDVLSLLIDDYERLTIDIPPVSAAEIVRSLVNEHRLSQTEIIPLLGSKQKSTALLRGERPLDLRQATRAARYFNLPLETFVDPDHLEIDLPKASRRRR